MQFGHDPALKSAFPELSACALVVRGVDAHADVRAAVQRHQAAALGRLQGGSESDLPEIQAWRRAFQRMNLKPTQYRCASESLLRRLRKEGDLPAIHPLIDLCNAVSVAFAIPVAAIDIARVDFPMQVRHARGDERYEAFSGELEHPEPGEVTFADAAHRAHARRWTHRQSGYSAIREGTRDALIVCEAMHASGGADVARLRDTLRADLAHAWPAATIEDVPLG
jgi:DNA/RNA-binding domain of Phe-tRNA-synthetase-like protein